MRRGCRLLQRTAYMIRYVYDARYELPARTKRPCGADAYCRDYCREYAPADARVQRMRAPKARRCDTPFCLREKDVMRRERARCERSAAAMRSIVLRRAI